MLSLCAYHDLYGSDKSQFAVKTHWGGNAFEKNCKFRIYSQHQQLAIRVSVTKLVIYWTLGNFSKPLATINLPKSPTFLGNFCKGVKICHFSSDIIWCNFYRHLAIFFCSHCRGGNFPLPSTLPSSLKINWRKSQREKLIDKY